VQRLDLRMHHQPPGQRRGPVARGALPTRYGSPFLARARQIDATRSPSLRGPQLLYQPTEAARSEVIATRATKAATGLLDQRRRERRLIHKAPADSPTRTPIHPAKRWSEDGCIVSGSCIDDEGTRRVASKRRVRGVTRRRGRAARAPSRAVPRSRAPPRSRRPAGFMSLRSVAVDRQHSARAERGDRESESPERRRVLRRAAGLVVWISMSAQEHGHMQRGGT
jgi:hypothetical protein